MPRGRTRLKDDVVRATKSPTTHDIAWAAGIYEGEGCLVYSSTGISIQITQKERWILDKMRDLFGGKLYFKKPILYKSQAQWVLRITHERAVGFMFTVYTFLSPHRKAKFHELFGIQMMVHKGKHLNELINLD